MVALNLAVDVRFPAECVASTARDVAHNNATTSNRLEALARCVSETYGGLRPALAGWVSNEWRVVGGGASRAEQPLIA